jgi:D-serine deaminase-like pyridoxal phosphate-dependent protein
VLLAYPVVGANALRVRELAAENPQVQISVLAENPAEAAAWKGSRVGIFIDANPGMDRTGIEQDHIPASILHYFGGFFKILRGPP